MADRGKKLIMNGQTITFEHERNIIEVAKKAGIIIPTFCYHSSLSVYGACRICTVEVEGKGFQIACATPPRDGMIIKTNTDRIFRLRRMLIELLLANHDRDCTTCERSGNCKLQELSNALGITNIRFDSSPEREIKPENAASIVRNPNKCILCG
ncbi:MAG: 2Fe-2S iron-sulfur cluster-binding protein, partial [Dethiobacter sp.]